MAALGGYESEKEQAIAAIEDYLNSGAWEPAVQKDGVAFKTCPNKAGHSINVFYGSKVINSTVEKIVDFCWNKTSFDIIKQFDPDCLSWACKDIGEQERIVYQLNKLGWPIWDRSFVTIWFIAKRGDSTIIGYTGVVDPDFPEKPKDDVRGHVTFACLHLTPTADGKTFIQRLMHIDPAGSLPSSLVNRLGGRQVVDYINWLEKKV